MATTYTLIASNTLSSSAASVTFSAIPNTFTDLVLKISARSNEPGVSQTSIYFKPNLGTVNSETRLLGNGSTVSSGRNASNSTSVLYYESQPAATATANTFNNMEIYIPSYTAAQNKPTGGFAAQETNNATAYISTVAGLTRSTTAISSITIESIGSFVSGSSFFLYGIKNS